MSTQIQAPSQAAQPHVLAVDDDATIRQLIVDYLGQNELRVSAVHAAPQSVAFSTW